ncbi:hypothetical protein HK098_001992 [Nowakowskiella sp. JEL0407]|nr:hypothetical protein HK098_001992 [Nowakowskiella sp. JEL0407]
MEIVGLKGDELQQRVDAILSSSEFVLHYSAQPLAEQHKRVTGLCLAPDKILLSNAHFDKDAYFSLLSLRIAFFFANPNPLPDYNVFNVASFIALLSQKVLKIHPKTPFFSQLSDILSSPQFIALKSCPLIWSEYLLALGRKETAQFCIHVLTTLPQKTSPRNCIHVLKTLFDQFLDINQRTQQDNQIYLFLTERMYTSPSNFLKIPQQKLLLAVLSSYPDCLTKSLNSLFSIWNERAFCQSELSSQIHITECIILTPSLLRSLPNHSTTLEIYAMKPEFIRGVSNHLDSVEYEVRVLGMFLAEFVGRDLKIKDFKLGFEVQDGVLVRRLKKLEGFDVESLSRNEGTLEESGEKDNEEVKKTKDQSSKDQSVKDQSTKHSVEDQSPKVPVEDDLVPLNTGNNLKPKRITYIDKCLENIKSKDRDKIEQALPPLVTLLTNLDSKIIEFHSEDVLTTLLDLKNNYDIPHLDELKERALCLLLMRCVNCINLMITETFSKNASVADRLEVLTVITKTALELSGDTGNRTQPTQLFETLNETATAIANFSTSGRKKITSKLNEISVLWDGVIGLFDYIW